MANSAVVKYFKASCSFMGYLLREIKSPIIYVMAFVVGGTINFFMEGDLFHSSVPYIVPVVVQMMSRGSLNFFNRIKDKLLELPMEREDPVFIMRRDGVITHSGGKTNALFEKNNIAHIRDLVCKNHADELLEQIEAQEEPGAVMIKVFSDRTRRWYEVKTKQYKKGHDQSVLVWMNNITPRMMLDRNLSSLRAFSSDTVSHVRELAKQDNILQQLAYLIVQSGFLGVFIARDDGHGNFKGRVYKFVDENTTRSDEIVVKKDAPVPLLESRKEEKVVMASLRDFPSREHFEKAHPFHPLVKKFLGFPIKNFVNYHEGEFSIIAFNKRRGIDEYDPVFIETAVNNTRSIGYLLELARENDEQFIQKVMGLCAAAEYSDEITGKHIFRVNDYSKFLAEKMGMDREFAATLGQVASLHDIGKVAIPELIKLERKYTDDERAQMHMHTIYGAQIIKTMMSYASHSDPRLEMAYNLALNHHQTWDGSGYPGLKQDGAILEPVEKDYRFYQGCVPLKNKEIPMEALIASLADTYDALRSKRQYKPEFSHQKAMAIMAMDDRMKIGGIDRFGPDAWKVFEENHLVFNDIFHAKYG